MFVVCESSGSSIHRLIERFGLPQTGAETRFYLNHVLSYDQARRTPRWVAEHLSAHRLLGEFGLLMGRVRCWRFALTLVIPLNRSSRKKTLQVQTRSQHSRALLGPKRGLPTQRMVAWTHGSCGRQQDLWGSALSFWHFWHFLQI